MKCYTEEISFGPVPVAALNVETTDEAISLINAKPIRRNGAANSIKSGATANLRFQKGDRGRLAGQSRPHPSAAAHVQLQCSNKKKRGGRRSENPLRKMVCASTPSGRRSRVLELRDAVATGEARGQRRRISRSWMIDKGEKLQQIVLGCA